MVAPKKVSRKAFQEFEGERWNAMCDILALSELEVLTAVQRKAYLSFWYMSEIYNGGHWQYFCNKSDFDHEEVVESLLAIGAKEQAEILKQAMERFPQNIRYPETVEEFIDGYDKANMHDLDSAFANCVKKIEDCFEEYLDRYESEFIEWIP